MHHFFPAPPECKSRFFGFQKFEIKYFKSFSTFYQSTEFEIIQSRTLCVLFEKQRFCCCLKSKVSNLNEEKIVYLTVFKMTTFLIFQRLA